MNSRKGFTLLELIVTVAVIGIVSSIVIRSTYTFLQEQKLRQAANEFVSYLLTARAKALREADEPGKACEVQLNADTTVGPTTGPLNICNGSSGLPPINLLAASGGKDLTIDSNQNSTFYVTFTRMGTVASSNLSDLATFITLPRIFYFYNSATQPKSADEKGLQRCVMVDLNSLRMGWRKWQFGTPPNSPSPPCTYNGN